jgi:zinc protease
MSTRFLRRILPFVLLAPLLASSLPGASLGLEDPARRTRKTVLPNGLTVLTLEDHATPAVAFQMWVRVGSGDESRYSGLAHLFEHMMFRGTENLPPESHERFIEGRGGRVNAYTNRDVTVYFAIVTEEHLPLVIDLEAERLAHLDIGEASLESEREVVLEERRLRTEDDPRGRAYEALLALAFQAHPYRRPTIGWRSDVEKVNVEVCREFFRTFYAPNNIVIAIAGAFDADDALRRIERAFGGLEPAPRIPVNPTTEPPQLGERRSVVHFDVRGPVLAMAWHAPPSGHADAEALDVTSEILSGGRSSRLYRTLVYEAQQALAAHGSYWELRDAGIFLAFASVRPDASIERSEALLLEQVARLRTEPVSEAELDKAKRALEVSLIDGLATSQALASRIAREYVTLGRIRPLEERLAAIRAVSAEDVQRVVRTYLIDSARSVVHVVPEPEVQAAEEEELR